ncbi:MAG: hypothetical protein M3020_18895 [Myxococcota bacterium]|nr:hypothetical protein [Myxococcota bacterium]
MTRHFVSLLLALCCLAFALPVLAQQAAPANPHAQKTIPRDLSAPAADLPKGTIEALIADQDEKPVVGQQVRLGVMFQSVAEGESRSEKFAKTDELGRVRFDGLTIGSGYSYRVTLKSGAAEYSSMPISLPEDSGHRVRLHVFPVVRDVDQAYVGMRGIVYIETRDDVFQFQVMMRILNLGAVSWVPDNVTIKLPSGFKAFAAEKGMTDVRWEPDEERGAKLLGTFTPGQHDASFRFQVPKQREANAYFTLGMLPHVFEMRVIAAASATMTLTVDGYEPPRTDQTENGQRVVVTRRVFDANDKVETVNITLSGLPVPGPGRWIAALLAAALAASGFGAAWGYLSFDAPGKTKRDEELEVARELLLEELVVVERARREGDLGPRAHSDARKALLDALARLGPAALETALAAPKKSRKTAGSRRSEEPAERPESPSTG